MSLFACIKVVYRGKDSVKFRWLNDVMEQRHDRPSLSLDGDGSSNFVCRRTSYREEISVITYVLWLNLRLRRLVWRFLRCDYVLVLVCIPVVGSRVHACLSRCVVPQVPTRTWKTMEFSWQYDCHASMELYLEISWKRVRNVLWKSRGKFRAKD